MLPKMLHALKGLPRALRVGVSSSAKTDESSDPGPKSLSGPRLDPPAKPQWAGSYEPTLLVAGHSHRYAFLDYFVRSGETAPIAVLNQRDQVGFAADPSTGHVDQYFEVARSAARDRALPLALIWDGNQHNGAFLVESDERFSIFPAIGPWEDGHPRPLIPRSLFYEFFRLGLAGLRAVLSNVAGERVLLLGTPPPKTEDQIRAGISKEPLLVEAAAKLGMSSSTLRITPLAIRFELWRMTQELMRQIASEYCVPFITVPDEALVDGALRADASHEDATHANGVWGEIMATHARRALAAG
jgi:hypothetical protein